MADLIPAPSQTSPKSTASASSLQLPTFQEEAQAVSLDFTFENGRSTLRQLPETMSGGLAVLDYDGDGWLDVYVLQGGPFPPRLDGEGSDDRLFHNRGDGTFEDATETAGLAEIARGYSHGVTVGDVDNDGDPDLFVTRLGSYALYRNRGDGTFTDETAAWGLDGARGWPTSAAFADLDDDGDLDLYVCQYLRWDVKNPRLCRREDTNAYTYCAPRTLPSEPDRLFRNDGDHFVDVTDEAGIVDEDGRGLGVLAADLDRDGRTDLYVANDMTANFYFRNLGGMRFSEEAHECGVAASAEGGYQAGMGIGCGDLDGDGRIDLAVTNFYGEGTTFYHNLGEGLFSDRSALVGLAATTRYRLGFGIAMSDLNNDGQLDLVQANGHVNDLEPVFPYAMPAQVFLGGDSQRLQEVSSRLDPSLQRPMLGRGMAPCDLDNDGRLDLLFVSQKDPLLYWHNRTEPPGHFLTIRLEGTSSNRDGIGSVVTVEAGGRRQVASRFGGGSYQSSGDLRLHFGLADAASVASIKVAWPSGQVDRYENLDADTGYRLREGDRKPTPLEGFDRRHP